MSFAEPQRSFFHKSMNYFSIIFATDCIFFKLEVLKAFLELNETK